MSRIKQLMMPALAVALTASCAVPEERTVEFPLVDLCNTSIVSISKVSLTDSATVLSVEAQYVPHYWIQISSDSYLMADGKKYRLTDGLMSLSTATIPAGGKGW